MFLYHCVDLFHHSDKARYSVKRKTPAIRSKEITYRLCKALKECLSVTPTLTCIELQGLPLRDRDLGVLAKVTWHMMTRCKLTRCKHAGQWQAESCEQGCKILLACRLLIGSSGTVLNNLSIFTPRPTGCMGYCDQWSLSVCLSVHPDLVSAITHQRFNQSGPTSHQTCI